MGKNNKKKNKDIYARRRFFLKIIIIIILIFFIKTLFFKTTNVYYQDTGLIMKDNVVELKNSLIVDSKQIIYMSYDDVKNIYDENIYFDEANKKLVTTYNKHVALLELESNSIIINDAESKIKGCLKYIGDNLYLPISDMTLVYDFEYSYSVDTNAVILDSISEEKSVAKILKSTSVKNGKGIFSSKLEKLNENDEVVILNSEGNKYKVRTQNGIIGYVKSQKVDSIKSVRSNMKDSKIENVNILKKYSRSRRFL